MGRLCSGFSLARLTSIAVLVAVTGLPLFAQGTADPSPGRFLEQQIRPLIAPEFETPPVEDQLLVDYGAVVRSLTAWYEDRGNSLPSPQNSRALHIAEIRPWASLTYGETHRGFVRGQFGYLNFYKGDHYGKDQGGFPIPDARNHEWQGPYIDLAYYELDLDAAARKMGLDRPDDLAADLAIGRQFLYLGHGIAFGLNTDGISLDWSYGEWGGLVFGSQSVDRAINFGGLPNNAAYQLESRRFYGGQVEYQGWDRRDLYSYLLGQWDNATKPFGSDDAYDSIYWGIGSTGEVLFGDPGQERGIPNLRYHAEFIVERGTNRRAARGSDISAWAMDAGLDYFWTMPGRPRMGIEYARASGDSSRAGPPHPGIGSNVPGTTDNTFVGFGYLNAGASLSPLFSNLEFVRFAAGLRPFDDPESPAWQNLEIGTSSFFFWRPEAGAMISDVRANAFPGERYLGYEWDLFVNWRMSSDMFLLINYGIFLPNDQSFDPVSDNHHSRQFLTVNLNWLL